MKLKKYLVYLDDEKDVFKVAVPAKSEVDAKKFCEGNGEVIKIKDITDETPIFADVIVEALKMRNFGETEIDIIIRTLIRTGIAE